MILIVHIHSIPFHFFEFVKPIEDIIKKTGQTIRSVHYKTLNEEDVKTADKIIIAGTSLRDNNYLEDKRYFSWVKTCKKPILGICGGMQILAAMFDEEIMRGQEIGLQTVSFSKEFLSMSDIQEVYALHNNIVKPCLFDVYACSNLCVQAIRHPKRPLYGVLFHPEVRNKDMITFFVEKI